MADSLEPSRAALDEWAEQALGFQRWLTGLDDEHLRRYFGLKHEGDRLGPAELAEGEVPVAQLRFA